MIKSDFTTEIIMKNKTAAQTRLCRCCLEKENKEGWYLSLLLCQQKIVLHQKDFH